MGVEIVTFGCRLNTYESEVMRREATAAGLGELKDGAVIFNTCAVTAEAVRQAKQSIRKARRENPNARIIVTGCAAQTDPSGFSAMDEVDLVLGNEEKLKSHNYRALPDFGVNDFEKARVNDIFSVRETASHMVDAIEGRARAFVQVQNGCDHRCTFCIIPYGRGNSRSVPMGAVVEQVKRLAGNGYAEVVLSGVDLTSYGADLPGAPKLGRLVKTILRQVPDVKRLRLSSIDSIEADAELLEAIATEKRLMPHLHLSLQSGDDMILKRMKRRHLRDDSIRFCEEVRALRPDIVFGADIIAGFPTETEAMFENSLKIVEECGLTHLHVFPYSPREGTPAARMPQVRREVVKERAARLRAVGRTRLCKTSRLACRHAAVGADRARRARPHRRLYADRARLPASRARSSKLTSPAMTASGCSPCLPPTRATAPPEHMALGFFRKVFSFGDSCRDVRRSRRLSSRRAPPETPPGSAAEDPTSPPGNAAGPRCRGLHRSRHRKFRRSRSRSGRRKCRLRRPSPKRRARACRNSSGCAAGARAGGPGIRSRAAALAAGASRIPIQPGLLPGSRTGASGKITVARTVETEGRTSRSAATEAPKLSWFQRLSQGLARSSRELTGNIAGVFTKKKLDEDTLQDLEDVLIRADLGMETALRVTDALSAARYGRDVSDADVRTIMASEIEKVLTPVAKPLELDLRIKPHVVLVVGVNGTGKTTTIGKLAAKLTAGGLKVMLAAGDTFRAAAIEQLKIWGERTGVDRHLVEARRRRLGPGLRGLREGQGRRLRRADHRHRRTAAEPRRADGRAGEDRARARQARSGRAAHRAPDRRRHHRPERAQPGRDLPQRGWRQRAGDDQA